MIYAHTQRSTLIRLIFTVAAAGALAMLLTFSDRMAAGPRLTLAVVAVVLFVTAFVFSSLTIRVDSDHLTWHFGPGISSKSVARAAIAHAELTTTSALEGWGIHLTTRGWLYNVGGRRAVLITLHDRSQFLLGSDEPEVLVRALRSANSVRSPD